VIPHLEIKILKKCFRFIHYLTIVFISLFDKKLKFSHFSSESKAEREDFSEMAKNDGDFNLKHFSKFLCQANQFEALNVLKMLKFYFSIQPLPLLDCFKFYSNYSFKF